ncbi:MAG: hypothetical protein HFH94_14300 [Lachnospiraceae bacterium]|nr:transposon-encoded TnpW family protein [uncultured Acetatifactor sp.]MCI9220888.1 hypothetical protein [Lachnospiraceae bacterium]
MFRAVYYGIPWGAYRAGLRGALVKKIGRTTYIVRVHFSKTSRETMSDKIKRMPKNEIRQM